MSRKWIIGFAGATRPQGDGKWYDTFIGGQKVYPEDFNLCIPGCPLCGTSRTLVLQAFAPHNVHPEREIYLLACNSIKCALDRRSWFAMRLCKESKALSHDEKSIQDDGENASAVKLQPPAARNTEDTINWDTESESDGSTSSDLVADLAALSLRVRTAQDERVPLSATTKGIRSKDVIGTEDPTQSPSATHNANRQLPEHRSQSLEGNNMQHLKSCYVEVAEEPERSKLLVDDEAVDRLLSKYEKEETTRIRAGVAETFGTEKEDYDLAASENFDNFNRRISRAPEQILRYCYNGEPIWPKHPPPRLECQTQCDCGSPLVFEVQLLGSCLHYLQPDTSVAHHRKDAGMNFAAVAIYTCQADCTSSEILAQSPSFKMLKQTVLIQQDEW